MSTFELAALLLSLAAAFGWVNHRLLRLPHTIGLLLMGLAASLVLVGLLWTFPGVAAFRQARDSLDGIDFPEVVMNGMLAFLLFAGSMNVDLPQLRKRARPIAVLALVGTVLSTALVAAGFWGAAQLLGRPVGWVWAAVFGALISPTDPVAVLNTLKRVAIPEQLRVEMEGEALFNDGVGIVLFAVLLGIATGTHTLDAATVGLDLLREGAGGLLLGVVAGYAAYRMMRAVDDYVVEVLITLALVAATYAIAGRLGTSGPLAMVAAGLLVGDRAPRDAMSEHTHGYVKALWTLMDEVLNSVLFLLIGLEVVVLQWPSAFPWLAAAAVPIVLAARVVAVFFPLVLFRRSWGLRLRNLPLLSWGGVRGGISVALALSLPPSPATPAILAATYAVVLWTIVVQGGTLGAVARWTFRRP